jgi:hypothetical protein
MRPKTLKNLQKKLVLRSHNPYNRIESRFNP